MRIIATLIAVGLITIGLLRLCRWIARQDATAGRIVSLGVVVRLWTGLVLFWISYLQLPLLSHLQFARGFWVLSLDGVTYYVLAAVGVEDGFHTIVPESASPAFVRVLAVWMRIVGVSPGSPQLLNVLAYAATAALIVLVGRRDRSARTRSAIRTSLVGFTFSPALLVFGTQALKDQFFSLLLVCGCTCVWFLFHPLISGTLRRDWRAAGWSLAGLAVVMYLIAGIRAYVSFLIVCLVGAVLATFTWRVRLRRIPTYVLVCSSIVVWLWFPFRWGAGPYFGYYQATLAAALQTSGAPTAAPVAAAMAARQRFVEAGGGTNFVATPRAPADGAAAGKPRDAAEDAIFGLAALVVPISLLQWASMTAIRGGRGLLFITDADTLFLDATALVVLMLLIRGRSVMRQNAEYLAFAASLCLALALLIAYIVTNFGTMFRLRVMIATLIWTLPLALVRRSTGNPGATTDGSIRFSR